MNNDNNNIKITYKDIKKLRELTGCGVLQAKKALEYSNMDLVIALEYLRYLAFGTKKPKKPIN